MAATANARDKILAAAATRINDYTFPPNANTSGDHTGTLTGSNQGNFQNSQITLSSTGTLQNAGGGQITNGASIGSLNAGNITTGTLSAARIASSSISASKIATNAVTSDKILANAVTADKILANSVTTDKLNVSTLSAITANLGTVNAGTITGSADISITGRGLFNGAYTDSGNNASVHANGSTNATYGVYCVAGSAGAGCVGIASANNRIGITGWGTASGAVGVNAIGTGGAAALNVNGTITISTQTISNLTAGQAINCTNAVNATNAVNSNNLGGVAAAGWCRGFATNSGSATASGFGFGLTTVGTLGATVRVRASGNNMYIENFSDESLKTNIKDEAFGLGFINKLRPVTYQLREGDTKSIFHNFIAQEVKTHLSNKDDGLVMPNPDGTLSIGSIVSILTKAVQELSKEVEELKKLKL